MSDEPQLSPEAQFIQKLKELKEHNKGAFARLKRSAGNTLAESRGVHATFYSILPYGLSKKKEGVYFLVATLYSLADDAKIGSLGRAMRNGKDKNKTGEKGYDRRLQVLLDADDDQLPFRLRQIMKLLKAAEIPVNWEELLRDLFKWNYPDRPTQEKWARDYYTK